MKKSFIVLFTLALWANANSFNPQIQQYINQLKIQAQKDNNSFVDFSAQRGKQVFTSVHLGKRGKNISCSSCHSKNLRQRGKNIHTGKSISPLSPLANAKRLSKLKDVKKWLRRNFNDVYKRQGSAIEKGDVLYYINSK
jgi:cytochrome c553